MSTTVRVVAILAACPGKSETLHALLTGMAPHCRAEPGNLRWDLWRDRSDPARFVLEEAYRDEAAAAAHHATAHYRDYASKIDGLAERTVVAIEPVDVA